MVNVRRPARNLAVVARGYIDPVARHTSAPPPDGGTAPGDPGATPDASSGTTSGAPSAAPDGVLDVEDRDAAPDHDVSAVLRITPFRRLWLALGLSSFGDWLGLLATAALAKNLATGSYTAENFAIAGVFILRLAPAVVLGPLAGALADKLNRRWTLVLGDLLRFVLFASIPLVGTLTWLYVATVLIEIVALFWMPAKDATVPNLVPRKRLEAANQISLVATYGSAPLAALVYSGLALLTGVLDNWFSSLAANPVDLALWFNALTFLVSGLVIWRLEIPPRKVPSGGSANVLALILDGWKYVGSTPVVRGLVLGMLGAFAAAGFVIGLAQSFVTDLGAGQPGFGVLFGAVFVGLALGMWTGPRLLVDFSRRRLFGVALTMAGVFLVLLAAVPNIVMATLFTTALGACGGIAWVTGYTLLGLEVDDEVRGRTFGFLQSAARVVLVLVLAAGPALAAPIGKHTFQFTQYFQLTYNGPAWVFLFAGVLAVVMGVTSFRQMDDRRGTKLVTDLRRAWAARAEGPRPARRTAPGYFVAFEGGDGAGKSTQAKLLGAWLRDDEGHEVVLTREPGATPVGVRLRDVLLGHEHTVGPRAEALLFAADRAHHVATVVRPALERGAVVVTDRYVDSSVAYQGAGRALDPDDVARLSRWATDGLVPDLTILLDLPPQISKVRRRRDAERSEGDDAIEVESDAFHERVRERFLDLARREPHRYLVLDASEDRADLQAAIRARLVTALPVSARKRAELTAKLTDEEQQRARNAAAEAEVLRLDRELRGRQRDESIALADRARRLREEAEQAVRDEQPAGAPARAVPPTEALPTAQPAPPAPSTPSAAGPGAAGGAAEGLGSWPPLGGPTVPKTPPPTAFRAPAGPPSAAPAPGPAAPSSGSSSGPSPAPASRPSRPAAPPPTDVLPATPGDAAHPGPAVPRLSGSPSQPGAPDAVTAVVHALPTVEISAADLALARGTTPPPAPSTSEPSAPASAQSSAAEPLSRRRRKESAAVPAVAGRFLRRLRGDGDDAARPAPPTAAIDLRDEVFGDDDRDDREDGGGHR